MNSETTAQKIESMIKKALDPVFIQVEDQSHLHAGHAGAAGGGGHFYVTVISAAFEGKSLIEQHRLVQETLKGLFPHDIHALALKTDSPAHWKSHS